MLFQIMAPVLLLQKNQCAFKNVTPYYLNVAWLLYLVCKLWSYILFFSFSPLSSVGQIRDNLVLAVNHEFVGGEDRVLLHDGDQVAVIPPISGG